MARALPTPSSPPPIFLEGWGGSLWSNLVSGNPFDALLVEELL